MKKFAFALQVFGINALILICVILELNRELPGSKNLPITEKMADTIIIRISLTSESQSEHSIPVINLKGLSAPGIKNKLISDLTKAGHKAY